MKNEDGDEIVEPGVYELGDDRRLHVWISGTPDQPEGDEVHHKCKVPACVNPAHLERLTEREHDVESFLRDRAGGLTLDDVRAIRQLGRTVGVTAKQVAEQYGIHEITVFNYWGQEPVWADLLNDGDPVCRPVRSCAHCGAEFSHRYRNAVYCSIECREKFNHERTNERRRERRAERRAA